MSTPVKALTWQGDSLRYIDQELLPGRLEYILADDYVTVVDAIKSLKIRGAPAIGIAAAYAAVLAVQQGIRDNSDDFSSWLLNAFKEIENARPTAKNLTFAVDRMREILKNNSASEKAHMREKFLEEANRLYDEDIMLCDRIGEYGAELIEDNYSVITHCNTGMLVSAGIGTALGVLYTALRQGKRIHVFADETRPLLQGARLTTWECMQYNIPVTLISDGAAADVLRRKNINCAIVGADRIAANGDVANKIGTYSLAVNCRQHSIPFYVAAPYSTFDHTLDTGEKIPIEERSGDEVSGVMGTNIAPKGVQVYNPAFDVTPAELITAIITDAGIYRYPYGEWKNLKRQ